MQLEVFGVYTALRIDVIFNKEGCYPMKLSKKIILWMLTGLFFMFLSAATISFCIERQFYRQQVNNSAHDMAIALSYSLSTPMSQQNTKQMNTVINEVFDQCVFYLLELRGVNDELLLSRSKNPDVDYAPNWFVELIRWTPFVQTADISKGGQLLGTVWVSADTGYAYDALWNGLVVLLVWFVIWAAILTFGSFFLVRWLDNPLQRITRQAKALGRRQFILEKPLPTIIEFKKVALAMNQTVKKLKKIFLKQLRYTESLRCQLLQDKLTGFGNRRYFLYQITSQLYRDEGFTPGFIVGVAVENLVDFKQNYGEMQVEQFIKELGNVCTDFWRYYPDLSVSHIDEGVYALIIKENDEQLLIEKTEEFNQKLQKTVGKNKYVQLVVGVVSYQAYHEESLLVGEFKHTLTNAKNESNFLALSENLLTHSPINVSADAFAEALSQQIEYLTVHPVSDGEIIFHQELAIKIPIGEELFNGSYLAPMARAVGLTRQLDSFVIQQICEQELLITEPIAFTLSDVTLSDEQLLEHYLLKLKVLPVEYRQRLSFELNESYVLKYFSQTVFLFNALQQLGIKLGVKEAGIHYTAMSYLNDLPVSYLKLHGGLSHQLDEDKQFIIQYLLDLAGLFAIKLVATEVQNEDEWVLMKSLGITWGQGVYFDFLENESGFLE